MNTSHFTKILESKGKRYLHNRIFYEYCDKKNIEILIITCQYNVILFFSKIIHIFLF